MLKLTSMMSYNISGLSWFQGDVMKSESVKTAKLESDSELCNMLDRVGINALICHINRDCNIFDS